MATGTTRLAGRPSLTRATHKDGRKLCVEMTFALVKDDAGKALGSVAIVRDVTERVEREKAARGARRDVKRTRRRNKTKRTATGAR